MEDNETTRLTDLSRGELVLLGPDALAHRAS